MLKVRWGGTEPRFFGQLHDDTWICDDCLNIYYRSSVEIFGSKKKSREGTLFKDTL